MADTERTEDVEGRIAELQADPGGPLPYHCTGCGDELRRGDPVLFEPARYYGQQCGCAEKVERDADDSEGVLASARRLLRESDRTAAEMGGFDLDPVAQKGQPATLRALSAVRATTLRRPHPGRRRGGYVTAAFWTGFGYVVGAGLGS